MNQKQPKANDAVLGGDSPPPVNAAVLGGLTGVKVRLASGSEAVQLSALKDALKYGDEGRQLLGEIFQRENGDRSWNAYHVLWKAIAPEERQLFLPTDGRVALPKLAKQGILQRFGRGLISNFFFLNKNLLLVCATSGAIIVEIETGEVLWELDCPNKCSAFSSDRSLLALGNNRHIYLWDIRQATRRCACLKCRLEKSLRFGKDIAVRLVPWRSPLTANFSFLQVSTARCGCGNYSRERGTGNRL